jgi:hypothetical protein
MDTPTVVAYDSKVKLFFSIIIFNTCDKWMLHHDMRPMSFIEVLTWIKEGVDHAWKGWIMKHLDWGPNTWIGDQIQVLPMLPPGLMRSWLHQVQTFKCPHGLHLAQLGEDMVVLQFER